MSYCIVKIREPSNPFYPNIFPAIFINTTTSRTEWVIIRNIKLSTSTIIQAEKNGNKMFENRGTVSLIRH